MKKHPPKRGRGRPPKPSHERRIHLLRIRVNDEELESIKAAAQQVMDGDPERVTSTWARDVLVRAAKRRNK